MDRIFLAIGALAGFLSVASGAFGAHKLKETLAPDMLVIFETGARYQMYHALALLAVGLLAGRLPNGLLTASGWLITAGMVIFSGTLYALAISGVRWLGAITPIGGVCFLAGWLCLAIAAMRGARLP